MVKETLQSINLQIFQRPSSVKAILYGRSKNPKLLTIKIICDGLDITLAEFFDTDEFNNLEQEIK